MSGAIGQVPGEKRSSNLTASRNGSIKPRSSVPEIASNQLTSIMSAMLPAKQQVVTEDTQRKTYSIFDEGAPLAKYEEKDEEPKLTEETIREFR